MAYTYTCIFCEQPARIPYNKPDLSTARLRVCDDCSALRPTPSSMAKWIVDRLLAFERPSVLYSACRPRHMLPRDAGIDRQFDPCVDRVRLLPRRISPGITCEILAIPSPSGRRQREGQ